MTKLLINFQQWLRLFIFLTVFLPLTSAYAVKVSSLYQADVTVASQATEEREQAVREGFLQVLMKVSGDTEIEKNPLIRSNLKRAEYYVQEYSYQTPSTTASQYILQIHYNITDVNRLLKKAGVASWGQNRPLILVWLAVTDNHDNTEIIGNESAVTSLLDYMEMQAKNSGLPVIFPMMDVEDMDKVSTANVLEKSMPILREVSKRYTPDALLIGHLQQHDDGYESEWHFILNNKQWDWTIPGTSAKNVISSVLLQIGQTLSKQYTVKPEQQQQSAPLKVQLEVTNITQRDDLIQLMQYLKQLGPVQDVELLQVSGNTVKLSVLIQGTLATFQQHASIGQHLIPNPEVSSGSQLVYEWAH